MSTMFTPTPSPRVFALPPGIDFVEALARGLAARLDRLDPLDAADVEVWLNARTARERLIEALSRHGARILPRLRVVTELAAHEVVDDLPAPETELYRALELTRLIEDYLERTGAAPPAAAFDMAVSLGALLDEAEIEGVPLDRLCEIDAAEHAEHWQRSAALIRIAIEFRREGGGGWSRAARMRAAAERLAARWQDSPPAHPVIVAGSTGSRGATRRFMEAVARLPQGALVLPALDPFLDAAL
ncbi:MAG: double-strand break repair protein AddB, partial [Alphaproteobacteria bacterium]